MTFIIYDKDNFIETVCYNPVCLIDCLYQRLPYDNSQPYNSNGDYEFISSVVHEFIKSDKYVMRLAGTRYIAFKYGD